jgi:hypothetical protein
MIGVRSRHHLYGTGYNEAERRVVGGAPWFFDLRDDPFELRDRAGEAAEQDIERDLCEALRAWDRATPWLNAPKHLPRY